MALVLTQLARAAGARVLDASGGAGPDVVFDGPLGETVFVIAADGDQFSAHGAPGGKTLLTP
jgi:NADPH2:quinone reductase